MTVNYDWFRKNAGYDPFLDPLSDSVGCESAVSGQPEDEIDYALERLQHDSMDPKNADLLAASSVPGLARYVEPDWPVQLAPTPEQSIANDGTGPLPKADVLLVTWTVDEGHALAAVLSPGKDSKADYIAYTHNYESISRRMRAICPARQAKRLGAFWLTKIGCKTVLIFKSESHLSQDTEKHGRIPHPLPNYEVWKQIIEEVQPTLVLTTGTSGGIGSSAQVGDVVVSPIIRFDCLKWLKDEDYRDAVFHSSHPDQTYFAKASELFMANSSHLPKSNTRAPDIVIANSTDTSVVTTDFFGFDISNNYYKLQGLGSACEMGDAILGQVVMDMPAGPRWLSVRNVSDPQIEATGTLAEQTRLASHIYKTYGKWSSVCSAIVCWALIAAEIS